MTDVHTCFHMSEKALSTFTSLCTIQNLFILIHHIYAFRPRFSSLATIQNFKKNSKKKDFCFFFFLKEISKKSKLLAEWLSSIKHDYYYIDNQKRKRTKSLLGSKETKIFQKVAEIYDHRSPTLYNF